MGFALYRAQVGARHPMAETMKGFGSAAIVELVGSHDGNAYRAVYTVKFAEEIYVLHAFQKKSKSGIATSKADIELVKARLALAERDYVERYGGPRPRTGRH